MGRPPLKPGEHGNIAVTGQKPYIASTWYRDMNAKRRRMERQGVTKSAARANLLDALQHITTPTETATLEHIARAWWKEYQAQDTAGTATVYRYGRALDTIIDTIGQMPVATITPTWVNQHLTQVAADRSPSAATRQKVLLTSIFDYGVRFAHLTSNPARAIREPRKKTAPVVAPTLDELDEARALFERYDHMPRTSGDLTDIADLFTATGMRTGELLALQWNEVDLEAGTATVAATITNDARGHVYRQDHPKTKAGYRKLNLPLYATERLTARAERSDGPYVFGSRAGGMLAPSTLGRAWRMALKDAPERVKLLTPRNYRKAVATHLAHMLDDEAASRQLGHAPKLSTAARHYIQRVAETPDVRAVLEGLRLDE